MKDLKMEIIVRCRATQVINNNEILSKIIGEKRDSIAVDREFELSLQDYLALQNTYLQKTTYNNSYPFISYVKLQELYIQNQDALINKLNTLEESTKKKNYTREFEQFKKDLTSTLGEVNKNANQHIEDFETKLKNFEDTISEKENSIIKTEKNAKECHDRMLELKTKVETDYTILVANISAEGYRREANGFKARFSIYSVIIFLVLFIWFICLAGLASLISKNQSLWSLSLLGLNIPFFILISLISAERKDAKKNQIILTEKANAMMRLEDASLSPEDKKILFDITIKDPLEYEMKTKELKAIKAFAKTANPNEVLKQAITLIKDIKKLL